MVLLTQGFLRKHREILIKRSQVFKDYLTHPYFVSHGTTVTESERDMHIFLYFLYANKLVSENLVTIFKLSIKYKVDFQPMEFESMCTSDNIPRLFEVAKELGDVANPFMNILKQKIQDNPLEIFRGQGIADVAATTVKEIVIVFQQTPTPNSSKQQKKEQPKMVSKCGEDEQMQKKGPSTTNASSSDNSTASNITSRDWLYGFDPEPEDNFRGRETLASPILQNILKKVDGGLSKSRVD